MAGVISNILKQSPRLVRCAVNSLYVKPQTSLLARNFSIAMALHAPKVQHPAPDFKGMAVIGEDFKEIKLSDYKGKYLVLVFYPLDFTFVCPTELIAFDDRIKDFEKLNAQVVGVSVDSHYTHLGWMNTKRQVGGVGKLRYPLLSDLNKNIAKDYGVLIESDGIALRGLFIIDPNGILRQMSINDLPIGRSVDETIRLIEAIKFVEEHGEVCPANWQKGDKTIKPDPKGSQEYFQSVKKD